MLWKKVMPRLSAGRVQSVATRLVVDRERERIAFRAAPYWDVQAVLRRRGDGFDARLVAVDGRRVAQGRDFDATAARKGSRLLHLDEAAAAALAARLERCRSRCARSSQALPPLAVRAVPDHDAAAGGGTQARLLGSAPCGSRSGSTRTATSPICAPTP